MYVGTHLNIHELKKMFDNFFVSACNNVALLWMSLSRNLWQSE